MDTIGERLKFIREKIGLSQKKFADSLGISKGSIILYEKNDRSPDSSLLKTLFEKYKVSPNWLFLGQGEPFIGEHQKAEGESKGEVIPIDGPMDEAIQMLIEAEQETGIIANPELRRKILKRIRRELAIGSAKDMLFFDKGNKEMK